MPMDFRHALCRQVAVRLGKDPEQVDADFSRMEIGNVAFDNPEFWGFLEAVVIRYEENVVAMEAESPDACIARIARHLGMSFAKCAERLPDLERSLGSSLYDPVDFARISVAMELYRIHKHKWPPLGDPAWPEHQ